MWLQYGRNFNTRSNHWKKTSQDGTRKDQGSQEMENTDESQGHRKFPRICKLLQKIYLELQSYGKAIKRVKGKERMDMEQRTWQSLWRTQREKENLESKQMLQDML